MLKFNMVEVILEQLSHAVWLLDISNYNKESGCVSLSAY